MRFFFAAILCTFYLATSFADEKLPLRVGVLPYLSTQKLIERYTPLRDYLEKTLNRTVILVTAPDFKTFVQRARKREYDVYITAPHFAALAESESQYRRVGRWTRNLRGVFVVAKNSPVTQIEDLRGKSVALPAELAIVSMVGEDLLSSHGLRIGEDVSVEYKSSHNSAILEVVGGNADAAVASREVYGMMAPDITQKVRELAVTDSIPHMMIMASSTTPDKDYEKIRDAILRFNSQGAGKLFFQNTGYGDMGEITDEQMKQLLPYVEKIKQRLNH